MEPRLRQFLSIYSELHHYKEDSWMHISFGSYLQIECFDNQNMQQTLYIVPLEFIKLSIKQLVI